MPTEPGSAAPVHAFPADLPVAVLFDMDGTLVDTEILWFRAQEIVSADLGGTWSPQDHEACLGRPLERVAEHLVIRSGTTESNEQVLDRVLVAMEHLIRTEIPQWRPGARALLQQVRSLGLPTALVSAAWERLIQAVQDSLAADLGTSPFDVIVAGDHVTSGKPDPDPYLMAARLLGVSIADCLAIEDSPPGVQAAFAAGCAVIAIPHVVPVDRSDVCVIESLEGRDVADLWTLAREVQVSV